MAENRTRLLIVSYVFPPFAAVGVYRILKLCKYFPEFNIEPIILTPRNPNVLSRDEGLLESVSDEIIVCRTISCEPFRVKRSESQVSADRFDRATSVVEASSNRGFLTRLKQTIRRELSIPDGSYLWSWAALKAGIQVVFNHKIDIVLSSSPPQSVHLFASRISRLTGRPHVVDFRDLWTQNTSYKERGLSPRLSRRDRRMELSVLRHAAGITVNTPTFKSQLLKENSFLDPKLIKVVSNGVDSAEFRPYTGSCHHNERFTIVHSGSLYGGHRNPEFFLHAVKALTDCRPEIKDRLRILFIGNWSDRNQRIVDNSGVRDSVEILGWLPQHQVFSELFKADLLLLIQGFDPVLAAAVPRKLFEYILSGIPILGFAPDGEIPRLIEQYKAGVCFREPSPKPIVEYLSQAFDDWQYERGRFNNVRSIVLRDVPDLETRAQVQGAAAFIEHILTIRKQ